MIDPALKAQLEKRNKTGLLSVLEDPTKMLNIPAVKSYLVQKPQVFKPPVQAPPKQPDVAFQGTTYEQIVGVPPPAQPPSVHPMTQQPIIQPQPKLKTVNELLGGMSVSQQTALGGYAQSMGRELTP